MKVYEETSLWTMRREDRFWAEASDHIEIFTPEELDNLEFILEDLYPDGIDMVTLNDIFRFDIEQIASQVMNYEDFAKRMNWDISDLNPDIWDLPF